MNIDLLKLEKIKARKEKNQLKIDTLSSVINEVESIELKNNKKLDDVGVASAIKKVISQINETLEFAKQGKRDELALNCVFKISLLQELLPKQLDDSELEVVVQNAISSVGALSIKDMGKVMAELRNTVGASADMNKLSGLVKQKLTK